MMDINVDLLYKFIRFLIKKTSGWTVKNEIISNEELVEVLHEPNIWKFNKRKVHSPFIDNISGSDLGGMQLISKFDRGFRFLLSVINIYEANIHRLFLFKKGTTITNAF